MHFITRDHSRISLIKIACLLSVSTIWSQPLTGPSLQPYEYDIHSPANTKDLQSALLVKKYINSGLNPSQTSHASGRIVSISSLLPDDLDGNTVRNTTAEHSGRVHSYLKKHELWEDNKSWRSIFKFVFKFCWVNDCNCPHTAYRWVSDSTREIMGNWHRISEAMCGPGSIGTSISDGYSTSIKFDIGLKIVKQPRHPVGMI